MPSTMSESEEQRLTLIRIQAESIHSLYRNSPVALFSSTVVALLLVNLLWGIIAPITLLTWLGVYGSITTLRVIGSVLYFRRKHPVDETKMWERLYFTGALLSGLTWGATGYLFFTPEHLEYQVFLYFILVGLGAGAFASHISHLPSFYAFFLPTLLPILSRTLYEDDRIHLTMFTFCSLYVVSILFLSRNTHRTHIEAIRLRYVNELLLEKVRKEHRLAEHANQAKSRFLAAASHDLRQPLFALGLFTQQLFDEKDNPLVQEIAMHIERSFTSLKDLLNSLLDISKLDAGVITVNKQHFALQDILNHVAADCRPLAQNKGLTLRILPTRAVLYSDPQLLQRILRNLTLNAIRYTHHGTVLVGLRRRGDHYELQVHDTGIGIPAHELENIFQEFHQVDNPERDREKGLGLGLSIVQRLINLLGSEVRVQSYPGRGSCFSFAVPHGTLTAYETPPADTSPMPDTCRILVIDDDPLVLHATTSFLQSQGYSVLKATGEDEALSLLAEQNYEPDLIVTDYRLRNNRNGIDAVFAVRQRLNRNIPVILVTGDTDPDRIRETTSHAFHLLHKPVSPQLLHSTITFAMAQA